MSIPQPIRDEAEIALDEFCAKHSSDDRADAPKYAYQFESNAVLLLERRRGFMNAEEWVSRPIAKLRYSEARNTWSLYWTDANGKWHRVSNAKPEADIRSALQVVIDDPLGVFWS